MSTALLTKRQQEIWEFLVRYVDAHGYPPTVREIGEEVGLASPSTVHAHLANLERAGLIKRDPTKPRALELSGRAAREPEAGEVHTLPLLGQIAAGGPLLAEQNVETYLSVPEPLASGGEEFLLRVARRLDAGRGDPRGRLRRRPPDAGRAERRDRRGARRRRRVDGRGDREAVLPRGRVRWFQSRVRLQPENAAYEPIYADHVQILGRVTGVFRTL